MVHPRELSHSEPATSISDNGGVAPLLPPISAPYHPPSTLPSRATPAEAPTSPPLPPRAPPPPPPPPPNRPQHETAEPAPPPEPPITLFFLVFWPPRPHSTRQGQPRHPQHLPPLHPRLRYLPAPHQRHRRCPHAEELKQCTTPSRPPISPFRPKVCRRS